MYCILVRHGQTAWNKEERYRGRTDLPLTDEGVAQAQKLARGLAGEPIRAIYASPLQRGIKTGEPLAAMLGIPVTPLEGLIDIDLGDWQGLTPRQASELYPELYRSWLAQPQNVHFPMGESLNDVRERLVATMDDLYRRHAGDRIVLVSHQAVNKVLLALVLGLDNSAYWRIAQDNGCLNRFERQREHYTILSLNEVCHLRQPG